MGKKFGKNIQSGITNLSILLMIFISVGCIFNMSYIKIVDKADSILVTLFCAFTTIILALFLYISNRFIDYVDDKKQKIVSIILFLIYLLINIFMIINLDSRPATDSATDIDVAWSLNNLPVDTENYHIHWIEIYSNNYALILLFKFLLKGAKLLSISNVSRYMIILNFIWLFLGLFICYRIGIELGNIKKGNKVLLLLVLNPLYYYLTFWVYSMSVSLTIFVGIILLLIKINACTSNKMKLLYSTVIGIAIAAGILIRVTAIFPVIAYIVVRLLKFNKQHFQTLIHNRKYIISLLSVIVTTIFFAIIPYVIINNSINYYFGDYKETNLPMSRQIYMGSHGDGTISTEFEDTGFDLGFTEDMTTKEKSERYIKGSLYLYKNMGIANTLNLWYRKLAINFSDAFPNVVTRAFRGSYSNYVIEMLKGPLLEIFSYAYRILLCLGVLLYLFRAYDTNDDNKLMLIVTLFGSIFFYLFWEVKGDYSLSVIPLMIILAQDGLFTDSYKGQYLSNKYANNILGKLSSTLIILSVTVPLIMYSALTQNTNYEYTRINSNAVGRVDDLDKIELSDQETLTQTFYTESHFNKLIIDASESQEGEPVNYNIVLENEAGDELYFGKISTDNIKNKKIRVDLPLIDGNSKYYRLKLKALDKITEDSSKLVFYTGKTYVLDSYKGKLNVSDHTYVDDLSMKVTFADNGAFYPNKLCLLICLALIVINMLIVICFKKMQIKNNF